MKRKLTTDDVVTIKKRLIRGEPKSQVARQFGVSHTLIRMIAAGEAWPGVVVPGQEKITLGEPPDKKLTPDEVRRIRDLIGHYPDAEIAHLFGISRETVKDIRTNRTWKSLPE